MKHRVAVIAGDGIGPEVIEAAIPILDRVAARHNFALLWERLPYSADHYLKTKETLPDSALEHLRNDVDAIFLGALGDPRVPGNEHARDILLGLRFKLDLYVNFRPVQLLHPDLSPLRNPGSIDFVIFRENTEGLYLGRGRSSGDEHVAEEVNTGKGVERIIRAAYAWADTHGRRRVTMSDKSNAIPTHRVWQDRFKALAQEYPHITPEHRYVDALALELVREPGRFEVIVTNNLYGDILSDLGAGLVGGLGIAASANLHPGRPGLFEPVHGSAPTLAGKRVANPTPAIPSRAPSLGEAGAAARDRGRARRARARRQRDRCGGHRRRGAQRHRTDDDRRRRRHVRAGLDREGATARGPQCERPGGVADDARDTARPRSSDDAAGD